MLLCYGSVRKQNTGYVAGLIQEALGLSDVSHLKCGQSY